jgi:hypothetical protein
MVSSFLADNKVVAVALGGLSFFSILFVYRKTYSSAALPPGPPPLPFVGNVFQVPKERPWLKYAEWTEQYGQSYLAKSWRLAESPDQAISYTSGRSSNTWSF